MIRAWLLVIGTLALAASSARSQGYPQRQITMVVPFAAGGPVDNIGRAFAEAMRRQLEQAVVIDNKPGGGGAAGTKFVVAARPDGYTLLIGSGGPFVVAPSVNGDAEQLDRQVTPVGLIAESSQLLVANPSIEARSFLELVTLAKARPGQMFYGSAGVGSMPHLLFEMIKARAGIDIVHVPYRSTGVALPDLISGRLSVMVGDITSVLPMVQAGRLRAFAIASRSRSELAPDVPTLAEAGLPGVLTHNWMALMGPAGLPPPVVSRLAEAMRKATTDEAYRATMRKQGSRIAESSPEHLVQYIASERGVIGPIVKAIGLKLE